jgi:site-specific DNA-methyltransferase (adenine-specific)
MGSGSTAIAALKSGRRFVGYETDPEYVRLSRERIARFIQQEDGESSSSGR